MGFCAAADVALRGLVGGLSATVAFGRATVAAPVPGAPGRGAFAVFSAMVGAPIGAFVVASLIVGAPAVGAPAVRRGMVGAGIGDLGAVGVRAGDWVAVGAIGAGGACGVGGLIVGAGVVGSVADGTAGGESAAFRVTLTVSFFSGTLDVCFDGVLFSFSLMRVGFFASRKIKSISLPRVKHASRVLYQRQDFWLPC